MSCWLLYRLPNIERVSVCCMQARRFPEGSESKIFYEVGLQQLLICFVIVVLISGGHHLRLGIVCITGTCVGCCSVW